MADFLLELRSEEIPARMQAGARAELEKLFRRELEVAGVATGEVTVWSTPRRLALIARELPTSTEAVSEEAKGPPVGAPDAAVEGFCRKAGVSREALEVRDVKGRETYFAVQNVPGRPVEEILAIHLPLVVQKFSWPKSMRWGEESISTESLRWVRPLSGIVTILGNDVLEIDFSVVNVYQDLNNTDNLDFLRVKALRSGNITEGHRFHHSGPITIGSADDYAEKLRACHVIVDHDERQNIVRGGARKAAEASGLTLVEDEGLVIENAGLTEWPVPLLGRFDESYLDVPPEVIQLTARVNQKYFVCEDADGKLANAFICTANIDAEDPAVVVDGNRKVLAARLSDARFFWELDQKTKLEDHAKKLERITFHEKLGTVADKVERVAKLAEWLASQGIVPNCDPKAARQAAELCKADLVTEMVGEFPELQGLMGGYYAEKEGLPQEVSDAIRDHYKPVGQGDEVPTAPVTVAVSLADKLDTLIGFFAMDEEPTGSKDPFALRRAAIGTLSLISSNQLRVSLRELVQRYLVYLELSLLSQIDAQEFPEFRDFGDENWEFGSDGDEDVLTYGGKVILRAKSPERPTFKRFQMVRNWSETEISLLDFFADRLKVQQREAGVRHDLIDAVFALGQETGNAEDDLVRLLARVKALQAFVETDNGANLLAGYKRAANILKKEEWAGEGNATDLSYTPEPAEKALIDALDLAEPKAAAAIEAEDFEAAMSALASLRSPIDQFFEEVTVNDNNEDKRSARLDLLARFRNAVHRVADFSRIEG